MLSIWTVNFREVNSMITFTYHENTLFLSNLAAAGPLYHKPEPPNCHTRTTIFCYTLSPSHFRHTWIAPFRHTWTTYFSIESRTLPSVWFEPAVPGRFLLLPPSAKMFPPPTVRAWQTRPYFIAAHGSHCLIVSESMSERVS